MRNVGMSYRFLFVGGGILLEPVDTNKMRKIEGEILCNMQTGKNSGIARSVLQTAETDSTV